MTLGFIKELRFLELEKEISEREDFLKEMTSIGQGQKYNAIIKGLIQRRKQIFLDNM